MGGGQAIMIDPVNGTLILKATVEWLSSDRGQACDLCDSKPTVSAFSDVLQSEPRTSRRAYVGDGY